MGARVKDVPPAVAARHDRIEEWLAVEGRLDVVDVAARLGVAQETVRRDLRILEADGRLQRVHGGAVPLETDPFPSLGRIPPGDHDAMTLATALWLALPRSGTILLGAGPLTSALTHVISATPPESHGLTVVTNSLDAAIALARLSTVAVYNLGGTVSAARAQEGDWALQELERLHVDVGVVCPVGITVAEGLGQRTPSAAAISQAEVACAQRVVVVAEASAVGRPAFVKFAAVDEIDQLLVAGTPAPAALAPLLDCGLHVTVFDGAGGPDDKETTVQSNASSPAGADW